MAETRTPHTPEAAQPEETYRPISNWALAGLLVSGGFALLVLGNVVVAFRMRGPLIFPEWMIILPVLGVILSWIAIGKIRDSEGTRAGMGLAKVGLWVGLVSGLGYFSYFYALRGAHIFQANQFLVGGGNEPGFFTLLKKAGDDPDRLDEAFFESLSPANRSALDAKLDKQVREAMMAQLYDIPDKNGNPGELSSFRNNYLVQAIVRGGEESKIEPSTVKKWYYGSETDPSAGGYRVVRTYRIRTPEFEDEVDMTVDSFEAERGGQKRKWYVNLRDSRFPSGMPSFTERGKGVMQLRVSVQRYLQGPWLEQLQSGRPLTEEQYDLLTASSRWERIIPEPESQRAILKAAVKNRFLRRTPEPLQLQINVEDLPARWGMDNGHFWILLGFDLSLPAQRPPQAMPAYIVSGTIKVKLKSKEDPLAFASEITRQTDWSIESIEFQRGRIQKQQ